MNNFVTRGALALALGLTLTACGGSSDDEPAAARTASNGDVYNDADVAFATDMIPHHAQAVMMVVMAQDRTLDPAMRELLDGIRETQVSEVETMVDWLTAWGQEIPETSLDHSSAHDDSMDHGDMGDMPGMMSGEELDELENSSDDAFADMWLRMMIEHHEGAIEMAEQEQEDGVFRPALTLARNIVKTQQAEIATMEDLLDS
ncbi:MAG TPA: DUF305 domain-containing protein [Nocardioidaceae bacterium]|nr:DUF305 domain-containing protein [Nocardioidaceae bacterium]